MKDSKEERPTSLCYFSKMAQLSNNFVCQAVFRLSLCTQQPEPLRTGRASSFIPWPDFFASTKNPIREYQTSKDKSVHHNYKTRRTKKFSAFPGPSPSPNTFQVCWLSNIGLPILQISAHATRVQSFLSVRESISSSIVFINRARSVHNSRKKHFILATLGAN